MINQNISLGVHIFVQRDMVVQMGRFDIRHHRNIRLMHQIAHGQQLKGGQLTNRIIRGGQILQIRQHGLADITADHCGVAGLFQHFVNQGGRCGLAVGAGNANDLGRAVTEEFFHLAGHRLAPLNTFTDPRILERQNAVAAENDVHLRQNAQIILA